MSDTNPAANAPTTAMLVSCFCKYIQQQEAMCLELENIADGLPNQIDAHSCLSTAQQLLPLVKLAHGFEEEQLFPALLARPASADGLPETIERLKFEHWGDEDFAEQVYHQIRAYVAKPEPSLVEPLAWTLRGFFQSMRRHIAFEREFLLPILKSH